MRKIKRECLICGKKIIVNLMKNGNYSGGHYFGKIGTRLIGSGKVLKYAKIGKHKYPVVDMKLGGRKIEYWECNECFNESNKRIQWR